MHINITHAKYIEIHEMDSIGEVKKVVDGISCIADGLPMSVPLDPANRHYSEIMRQV